MEGVQRRAREASKTVSSSRGSLLGRSTGRFVAGLAAVALSASLAACGATDPATTPPGAATATAASSSHQTPAATSNGSASATANADSTPSAVEPSAQSAGGLRARPTPSRTSRPSGMPGDRAVGKARRPGASSATAPEQQPSAATPATLTGSVVYPDGTRVRIVQIARGAQTAQGPGAFPGQAFAAVEVEVTAGNQPIDLNRVVVTALAGTPQVVVAPVYVPEAETADFTGRIAAGAKKAARYAYAVPKGPTSLRLVVDIDATHANAVFSGPLA